MSKHDAAPNDAAPADNSARRMGRREFIQNGSCTLASLSLLAMGAAGCASLVTHAVPVTGGVATLRLADFPSLATPGGYAMIKPQGFDHAVFVGARAGGEFIALPTVCTHRGCTLEARESELACPCHGSRFDHRGAVLRGPAERPLTPFPTVLRTDQVLTIQLTGAA